MTRPPPFLKVLPADIGKHGGDAACVLALVRYKTSLSGEHGGRRLRDGEMWWEASYEEIGTALGGLSRQSVGRTVRRLESAKAFCSRRLDDFNGDQTKAYRVPDDEPAESPVTSQCSESNHTGSESNDPPFEIEHSIPCTKELKKEDKQQGEGAHAREVALPDDTPTLKRTYLPSSDEPELGGITPPSRFCKKDYPDGTDGPCWGCERARKYRDESWPLTEDGFKYSQMQSTGLAMAKRTGRKDVGMANLARMAGRTVEEQQERTLELLARGDEKAMAWLSLGNEPEPRRVLSQRLTEGPT